MHDVVIVGAGAAGLSCALECFDVRLDTLILEAHQHVGGQLAEIPHSVRNVIGWRFDAGAPVVDALEASAAILGDRLQCDRSVKAVELAQGRIETDGGAIACRTMVIATGTGPQRLAAATDGAFGGDVTYQVESHWEHFAGHDVVVIGGGDSATLDALALARAGSKVKLVHRSPGLTARDDIVAQVRAEPAIEDRPGWALEALRGGDRLEAVGLRARDGTRVDVDAERIVIKIARSPRTELFRGQLDLDGAGAVVVDPELRTSQAGVFAAGDVVAGAYPRIATAMGQGVLAARSVLRHLQGRP